MPGKCVSRGFVWGVAISRLPCCGLDPVTAILWSARPMDIWSATATEVRRVPPIGENWIEMIKWDKVLKMSIGLRTVLCLLRASIVYALSPIPLLLLRVRVLLSRRRSSSLVLRCRCSPSVKRSLLQWARTVAVRLRSIFSVQFRILDHSIQLLWSMTSFCFVVGGKVLLFSPPWKRESHDQRLFCYSSLMFIDTPRVRNKQVAHLQRIKRLENPLDFISFPSMFLRYFVLLTFVLLVAAAPIGKKRKSPKAPHPSPKNVTSIKDVRLPASAARPTNYELLGLSLRSLSEREINARSFFLSLVQAEVSKEIWSFPRDSTRS